MTRSLRCGLRGPSHHRRRLLTQRLGHHEDTDEDEKIIINKRVLSRAASRHVPRVGRAIVVILPTWAVAIASTTLVAVFSALDPTLAQEEAQQTPTPGSVQSLPDQTSQSSRDLGQNARQDPGRNGLPQGSEPDVLGEGSAGSSLRPAAELCLEPAPAPRGSLTSTPRAALPPTPTASLFPRRSRPPPKTRQLKKVVDSNLHY